MAGAGGDEEVTLLGHWGSAYVTRVRLALHLKGVSYSYVEEDLRNKSDLLLRCNPVHRSVPVLIHNGRPICESRVILQYIDEAFGPPALLPADPHERAIARFWAAYADDVLGAPWEKAYRAGTEEERAGWMRQVVAATDALERGLSECTDGGSKGCFFGGERVGFVDVVLGGVVPLVHATVEISGDMLFGDAGRTPLLAAWLQRFGELDAAKALLPDVDRVVDYVRMILAKNAAVKAPAN
ncbi:probable glutathione S-transferase GSTU6 [Aegilops tauschii subsp. strangulata]|uniref:Glutathione S-transferase n=1 Tax=Aegilops tauschii subsp. strangulata TaxID=200361 RepID=A0A453DRX6_AEGTS|nr:probable glutathione S-transferase GSTU6 [Aegilops tauschii subsp. strangulata]